MKTPAQHMREWGPIGVSLLAVAVAAVALLVVYTRPVPSVIPATTQKDIVPAVGAEGYDVATFCNDSATVVTKDPIIGPESAFAASYHLDRTKDGVHETIDVGVYPDASRQPAATHYDSANVPIDAFVSKDAMKCIESKAK